MRQRAYADASALVKLLLQESGSDELRQYLSLDRELITSRVATVEVRRAIARSTTPDDAALAELWHRIGLMELDAEVAEAASQALPANLCSLDAIHLASALALRGDVGSVVTYDRRLAEAVRAAGMDVVSPGLYGV